MKILIPIDFTHSTINAIAYGLELAKSKDCGIALIHVAKDLSEAGRLTKDMHELLKAYTQYDTSGIPCNVRHGSIYETIQAFGEEINASLILLGIHETSTFAKVFGTKAIKVVSNSRIPIVTVKENSKFTEIKRILVTLDLARESIQVTRHLTDICTLFGAEVLVVGGKHTDLTLKQQSNINAAIAKDHFERHNIKSTVVLLERKKFLPNLIKFCSVHKIDLIAATYYVDKTSPFSISFIQSLLDNQQQIPVFTIDSQTEV